MDGNEAGERASRDTRGRGTLSKRSQSIRSRYGWIAALCVLMVLGALPVGAERAGAQPLIPEIAGTTTITFDGTSGIRLRVPEDVSLTERDFNLTLDGAAAFGKLSHADATSHADPRCKGGFPYDDSDPQWCSSFEFGLIDGWTMSPVIFGPSVQTLAAGRIDLYMVTEGRVTMTFTVPELDGTASFKATGLLDGAIVEHPVTCLTEAVTACDRQGWGGQQFATITPPAQVGSVSFTQRPNNLSGPDLPTPGSVGVGSCIYPSNADPGKSAGPAEHPRGCDPDESGGLSFQNTYLLGTPSPTIVSYGHVRAELFTTPGPAYTGFAAHQVESAEPLEGPGDFGSWGYWFGREIRCPSGDWTACGH